LNGDTLPPGIGIHDVPDPGVPNIKHFQIEPNQPMPKGDFEHLLDQIETVGDPTKA
jgi:hypothetical protein